MLAVVAATAAPMAAFADPVLPTRIGQPDCLGTTPTIIGRPTFLPVFTSLPLEAPLHQTFAIARLDKVQTDLASEPCLLGPYLSAEFTSSRNDGPSNHATGGRSPQNRTRGTCGDPTPGVRSPRPGCTPP
jgi:hypothetical protein